MVSGSRGPPRQRLFIKCDVLNRARLAGQAFHNFISLYQDIDTFRRKVWRADGPSRDEITLRHDWGQWQENSAGYLNFPCGPVFTSCRRVV